MSNILMVHPINKDITPAEEHGDTITYITDSVNVFNPNELNSSIQRSISLFHEGEDTLLLAGNILGNALALHHIMKKHGYANVLIFNAKTGRYIKRVVSA